jgi:16S rRNA (cytosine1402-N4)-methyltransferase
MNYHIPVLVREVIQYMAPKKGGVYVDATFGGGGHTRALLQAEPTCTVIACDWDKQAIEINGPALEEEFPGRVQFVWTNFTRIDQHLKKMGIHHVDGILADFGTSQYQIKQRAGFSFAIDTPLDMRMSPGHQTLLACDIVNNYSENDLLKILYEYGEESHARAIVRAILAVRVKRKIKSTGQLVDIIMSVVPRKSKAVHPATKTFQALRIVVNQELQNIHAFLQQANRLIRPGGRLVCISFHSLEDRLVKQFLRDNKAVWTVLTPRVIVGSDDEIATNPSSRSAKLRAGQKSVDKESE